MTRKELLSTPAYWIAKLQLAIYRCAEQFMNKNNMNRTQFAEHLGVSKGYVSQILSGDYNYSLSKMVEMSLSMGYVPQIEFVPIAEVIQEDVYTTSQRVKANSEEKYVESKKSKFNYIKAA